MKGISARELIAKIGGEELPQENQRFFRNLLFLKGNGLYFLKTVSKGNQLVTFFELFSKEETPVPKRFKWIPNKRQEMYQLVLCREDLRTRKKFDDEEILEFFKWQEENNSKEREENGSQEV